MTNYHFIKSALLISTSLALACGPVNAQTAAKTHNFSAPAQKFGRVSFDARSLMIDGERQIIWSSEFHYFRLPSPELWRDILQKMKASGFNTVALYFSWGYHSPKQGVYDFSGVRDVDKLLSMAAEEGLYVIVRPGPYANAELSRGGFPGWLVNQRARARTDDDEYLAAADEWLTQINTIIARHQINGDGKGNSGSVILYQIENELDKTSPVHRRYMDHLYAKVRSDGLTIPIFHNDKGRNGYWVPEGSDVPLTVKGPTDLYAWDSYPGGTCSVTGSPRRPSAAPNFGFYGKGGAKGGSSASPNTPGFAAEFGGGWFDYWGSNGSYECNSVQRGRRFQRVFYGTNFANGMAIQNFYMGYGGTSWGWMPAPVVYTSYDYGAAISEPRTMREKAKELKQLGGLIASVPDLAGMIPAGALDVSKPSIHIYHNASPETDARFLFIANNPSNDRTGEVFHFNISIEGHRYRIPSQGEMKIEAFDAKWLIANVNIERQKLIYSTSELQTSATIDDRSVLLLYGRKNEQGESVFHFASRPEISVLDGEVASDWNEERSELTLRYTHTGLARVKIDGIPNPATLLIADEETGWAFWKTESHKGDILVRGPSLVRSVSANETGLQITGDTAEPTALEIWKSASLSKVFWNGSILDLALPKKGRASFNGQLAGPAEPSLPVITNWKVRTGAPEKAPGFDDSAWTKTVGRRYSSNTARPDGQPNLLMDPYGFHEGDVWYRGRFEGNETAEQLKINFGAGGAGMIQAFLDGEFIGQHEIPSGLPRPITLGSATFALPDVARNPGEQVLSVLLRSNGHNWNLDADDYHKEARGLISVSIAPRTGPSFAVPISWRINGRSEDLPDPARGVTNNGGLHGEFRGWHLPEYDDSHWPSMKIEDHAALAGVTWYRSRFDLDLPEDQDITLGIGIGDTQTPRSAVSYRASIFVNGWNMGQFIAHIGPQRVFPVPEGILNHNGPNTIALAVISDGQSGNALENIELITLHNRSGGLAIPLNAAPTRPENLKQ